MNIQEKSFGREYPDLASSWHPEKTGRLPHLIVSQKAIKRFGGYMTKGIQDSKR
jgi:hypothetical protein